MPDLIEHSFQPHTTIDLVDANLPTTLLCLPILFTRTFFLLQSQAIFLPTNCTPNLGGQSVPRLDQLYSKSQEYTITKNVNHTMKRGQLYRAGTTTPIQTQEILSDGNTTPLPTSTLPSSGVVRVAMLHPTDSLWAPPTLPLEVGLTHPLLDLIDSHHLQNIKNYRNQPMNDIIVYSAGNPKVYIQTHHFRDLISHGKPINDDICALFLEIICSAKDLTFLCHSLYPCYNYINGQPSPVFLTIVTGLL
jgi:hypothetical protein